MNIRNLPELSEKDIERFNSKIRIHPASGCHEWQDSLRNGYGTFCIGGANYPAHRVAYVLAHGEPGNDQVIDHACRNRKCVNAVDGHLRPLTASENIRIGDVGRHNATKILCPRGHALAEFNLIPSMRAAGRACRSCDTAARAARHRKLQGQERETFIKMRADERYAQLRRLVREEVAA